MRTRRICMLFGIILALSMIGTVAHAALVFVEDSTKAKGATTITWDSSFEDLNYTLGSNIAMTVNWTVDVGEADYEDLELKKFTPKGRDPAGGFIITSPVASAGSVVVVFAFDELHLDRTRNVLIGNAHFKLILEIDKDGTGGPESLVGYGVNVHVEDPQ